MGYATTEKVAAGFKSAAERIDGLDMDIQELQEMGRALQKQLKRMYQSINAGGSGLATSGRFGPWASEEEAKTFGYCVLVALGREKGMNGMKDMGEITQTGGGVLVPTELHDRLIDLMPKYGKFRANATVLPVGSGESLIPQITSDLTVVCTGDGGTISKSGATFSMVKALPKTWAAIAAISNELDEDSVGAIGIIVGQSMARSFAKKEDLCGFLGDGTSTYFSHTGIVGKFLSISDTISEIAGLHVQAVAGAWSALTIADFRKVAGLLPEEFDATAKWYMSKRFYYDVVYAIASSEGVASIFEILSGKKAMDLLGYPVEFSNAMPKTGADNQICAILGDLSAGAYLSQRKGLTLDRSSDVYFASNQLGVRGIQRVDFNVFGCGDTTNPGPIVGLITDTGQ